MRGHDKKSACSISFNRLTRLPPQPLLTYTRSNEEVRERPVHIAWLQSLHSYLEAGLGISKGCKRFVAASWIVQGEETLMQA